MIAVISGIGAKRVNAQPACHSGLVTSISTIVTSRVGDPNATITPTTPKRDNHMAQSPKIFAVCNQKGGVGKTTTTFHLARAGIRAGLRTLLVDADPQGNLTAVATAEAVEEDDLGLADAISERAEETLNDVIVPGIWDGLDLVPTAGETLASVRDELVVAGPGRENRLREALRAMGERYDLILIDCAPSLDQLTINALTAADGAVVITHTNQFALSGLAKLLTTIESVRSYYNQGLTVVGIIVNHHDERTISGAESLSELTDAAKERDLPLLSPIVHKRVVISDAMEAARGLDQWGTSQARSLAEIYDKHLTAITGATS